MSSRYKFSMIEASEDLKENVDIVFASEYFEHFYDPIDHLSTIVSSVSPKYFVIGNAFNTWSIGHFIKYKAYNNIVDQSDIGLIFNKFPITLLPLDNRPPLYKYLRSSTEKIVITFL